ncbi:MAG: hypothetical protein IT287_01595 [Bdellovibrionaceae bacterium]|nr:hypothetical protein [Pseudobdellovibrionaceae bacterium]
MKKITIILIILFLSFGLFFMTTKNKKKSTSILVYDQSIFKNNCIVKWKDFCIGKGDFYKTNPEFEQLEEEISATRIAISIDSFKDKSQKNIKYIKFSGTKIEILNVVMARLGLWTPTINLEVVDGVDLKLWIDESEVPVVKEDFQHPELARLKTFYYLRYHEKAIQLLRIENFKQAAQQEGMSYHDYETRLFKKNGTLNKKPDEFFWTPYFLKKTVIPSKHAIYTVLPRPNYKLLSPEKSWRLIKGNNLKITLYDNITDSSAAKHRISAIDWIKKNNHSLEYIPILSKNQTSAWTFFRIVLCLEREQKGILLEALQKLNGWPQSDSEVRAFFTQSDFSAPQSSKKIDECSTNTKDDSYLIYYQQFAAFANVQISPIIAVDGFVFAQKIPDNYFLLK